MVKNALSEAWEERGAARQQDGLVQGLAQIDVAFLNSVVDDLVDAGHFEANFIGFEKNFGGLAHFGAELDFAAVGEEVAGSGGFLLFPGRGVAAAVADMLHVAVRFFDFTDDLEFGGGGEVVPAAAQKCLQMLGDVPPAQIHAADGTWDFEALVDRDNMRHPVAAVEHNAG